MKCNGAMLNVVFAPVVWSPHTTPSISLLRESALREKTKQFDSCQRDYAYYSFPNREKIKIIS